MNNKIFPGVRPSSTDFQAVRDGRRARPLYVEISLSSARSIANGLTGDITDTSGKALQLNMAGNAFYADPIYDSAGNFIAGVAVAHFEDSALGAGISTPLTLLPNSSHRIPFTSVIIENASQTGKKLRVIYGVDIDFTPGFNAQLLGAVMLDEATMDALRFADDDVIDGQAMFGGAQSAQNAGNVAHVQLKNPAANGVFLYLDRAKVTLSAAQNVQLRRYDTDATTNSGQAANKDLGGSAPVGQVRIQNVTAVPLGTLISEFAAVVASTPQDLVFVPPVRIGAGEGIVFCHNGTGSGTFAHFEWREKAT